MSGGGIILLGWAPITLTFSADRLDCLLKIMFKHFSFLKIIFHLISCFDPDRDDLMGLPETLRDLALALGMNTGTLFLSLGPRTPGVLGVAAAKGLWGRLPDEGKRKYLLNCTGQ